MALACARAVEKWGDERKAKIKAFWGGLEEVLEEKKLSKCVVNCAQGRKNWGESAGRRAEEEKEERRKSECQESLKLWMCSSSRKSLVNRIKWSALHLSAHPRGAAEGGKYSHPRSQGSEVRMGTGAGQHDLRWPQAAKMDQRPSSSQSPPHWGRWRHLLVFLLFQCNYSLIHLVMLHNWWHFHYP